jgi:hypothetical protein
MTRSRPPRFKPLILLLAFLIAPGNAGAQDKNFIYNNPSFGWSVVFSSRWKLEPRDRAFVRLIREEESALCAVHSQKVAFSTLTEFATAMQTISAEILLSNSGLLAVEKSHKAIKAGSGEPGQQVIVALVPGGMTQRAYFLHEGTGIVIDCETYVDNFNALSAEFTAIQNSFSIK